jgi:hypothetical protein
MNHTHSYPWFILVMLISGLSFLVSFERKDEFVTSITVAIMLSMLIVVVITPKSVLKDLSQQKNQEVKG